MAHIVAAEFDEFAQAESAVDALRAQGFPPSHLTKFFLNPPGQHAQFPIGGDRMADPKARAATGGAVKGAVLGSAAGLAMGLAAAPLVGPAAAAIGGIAAGAYAGSLAGAVSEMGKDNDEDQATGGAANAAPSARPSGVVVAVNVGTSEERERATSVFWRHRATSIELAEGTWNDGTWQDFDPLSTPQWRKAPAP